MANATKRIAITLEMDVHGDVPFDVLDWMVNNLANHAEHEFGCDYEPWMSNDTYPGPPLVDQRVRVPIRGRIEIAALIAKVDGLQPPSPSEVQ
jgi:hypothetical protein